jgi:hypothetical protein
VAYLIPSSRGSGRTAQTSLSASAPRGSSFPARLWVPVPLPCSPAPSRARLPPIITHPDATLRARGPVYLFCFARQIKSDGTCVRGPRRPPPCRDESCTVAERGAQKKKDGLVTRPMRGGCESAGALWRRDTVMRRRIWRWGCVPGDGFPGATLLFPHAGRCGRDGSVGKQLGTSASRGASIFVRACARTGAIGLAAAAFRCQVRARALIVPRFRCVFPACRSLVGSDEDSERTLLHLD